MAVKMDRSVTLSLIVEEKKSPIYRTFSFVFLVIFFQKLPKNLHEMFM